MDVHREGASVRLFTSETTALTAPSRFRSILLDIWIRIAVLKRSDAAGFEVLPKRWIVERTFAWISRNRRLARDFERYATTVAAFIRLAMIRIMLRRLAANASL